MDSIVLPISEAEKVALYTRAKQAGISAPEYVRRAMVAKALREDLNMRPSSSG